MGLIIKLILGIVAGIVVGLFTPAWAIQLLLTFKVLFGQLLFFTLPLLILFFITCGIAGLPQYSGPILRRTLGIAYASTIAAGTVAFFVAAAVVPMLGDVANGVQSGAGNQFDPFLQVKLTPVFDIMTALILAFIFGLGIAATRAKQLKDLS